MLPVRDLQKLSKIVSWEVEKKDKAMLVSWLNYSEPMTEVSGPLSVEVFTRGQYSGLVGAPPSLAPCSSLRLHGEVLGRVSPESFLQLEELGDMTSSPSQVTGSCRWMERVCTASPTSRPCSASGALDR